MATLYLMEQGTTLFKEGRRLALRKGKDVIREIPAFKIDQVVVMGNITLTTPVVAFLLGEGIDTVFLSTGGRYRGRLQGDQGKNIPLRRAQFRRVEDPAFTLRLAGIIVSGKISNMRTLLMRTRRHYPSVDIDENIHGIRKLLERVPHAESLESLRGCEGKASAFYFDGIRKLLQQDWGFERRKRRPPTDPVNSLLSFGYTLLGNSIQSAVNLVGLDAYAGFLHATDYGRPSLVLDLMEEFRPIIVDSIVIMAVNHRILKEEDFIVREEDSERPVLLTDEGRRRFIELYEERISTEVTHPASEQKVTYRRCFELQARALARFLQDENDVYEPMMVR